MFLGQIINTSNTAPAIDPSITRWYAVDNTIYDLQPGEMVAWVGGDATYGIPPTLMAGTFTYTDYMVPELINSKLLYGTSPNPHVYYVLFDPTNQTFQLSQGQYLRIIGNTNRWYGFIDSTPQTSVYLIPDNVNADPSLTYDFDIYQVMNADGSPVMYTPGQQGGLKFVSNNNNQFIFRQSGTLIPLLVALRPIARDQFWNDPNIIAAVYVGWKQILVPLYGPVSCPDQTTFDAINNALSGGADPSSLVSSMDVTINQVYCVMNMRALNQAQYSQLNTAVGPSTILGSIFSLASLGFGLIAAPVITTTTAVTTAVGTAVTAYQLDQAISTSANITNPGPVDPTPQGSPPVLTTTTTAQPAVPLASPAPIDATPAPIQNQTSAHTTTPTVTMPSATLSPTQIGNIMNTVATTGPAAMSASPQASLASALTSISGISVAMLLDILFKR